ncbi:hypothetical protein MUP01_12650 [Candidatus Bathyarchaeota archaeon]|nr:hypothetical protein [Candidatus Bathyarchaeota archaeon]
MNKKIMGLIAIVIVSTMAAATLVNVKPNYSVSEVAMYEGKITVIFEQPEQTTTYETHNKVTHIGLERLTDFMENGAAGMRTIDGKDNVLKYLSLSNDATPLATWTVLPGEIATAGLARAAATVQFENNTQYSVVYKWTFPSTATVQCVGIHWAAESGLVGNLWGAGTFTSTTGNLNDNITIIYRIIGNN